MRFVFGANFCEGPADSATGSGDDDMPTFDFHFKTPSPNGRDQDPSSSGFLFRPRRSSLF
jgi:hypothetical protein